MKQCNTGRFDLAQTKQGLISSIISFVYEFPHELMKDLRT